MKKTNSILSATLMLVCCLVLSLGAISCSKDQRCSCTTKYSSLLPESTLEVDLADGKCSDMNSKVTTMGVTATIVCEKI